MSDEIVKIQKEILAEPVLTVITLEITEAKLNELTWEQWEIFDNGAKANYRETREIVSLFVTGMDKPAAMAALGKLKTPEMGKVLDQFVAKVVALREVNPTTGGD